MCKEKKWQSGTFKKWKESYTPNKKVISIPPPHVDIFSTPFLLPLHPLPRVPCYIKATKNTGMVWGSHGLRRPRVVVLAPRRVGKGRGDRGRERRGGGGRERREGKRGEEGFRQSRQRINSGISFRSQTGVLPRQRHKGISWTQAPRKHGQTSFAGKKTKDVKWIPSAHAVSV